MINPHNPQFITAAPWYLNQSKPSLKHQQAWNLKTPGSKDWYKRGTKGDIKTKFLKGACSNCGAMTHQVKECMERPRKVKAEHDGKNLMPDEHIESLELDYEGKRDRWNGFQPDDYREVIEEWEKVEGERRKVKAAEMEERAKLKERLKAQKRALKKKRKQRRRQLRRQAEGKDGEGTDTGDSEGGTDSDTDTDTDSDSDASDDEDLGEKMKDFDKTTATTAAKDDKLRTTTRNLRIREDTAKYLLNLDVNSAFYDPKSRSMRDNPLKHLKEEDQGSFRGDNFVRNAGDAKHLAELTVFAWDAYKHGEKVHDTAQPTQALKMWQVFKERSKNLKETQQAELLEKYGGEEHLEAPTELIYAQNDNYVEYSRDGRVIKGRERLLQKSAYEEDVLIGNHCSPWGSWYDSVNLKWGFACCHQTMKNAYCVPLKRSQDNPGAVADAPAEDDGDVVGVVDAVLQASSSSESESSSGHEGDREAEPSKKKQTEEKRKARALQGMRLRGSKNGEAGEVATAGTSAPSTSAPASKLNDQRSSSFGHVLEDITDLDDTKVAEAVEREKKRRKQEKKVVSIEDERQRQYNSVADNVGEISPEEFEAYRLMKQRSDDPMAQFT